MAGRRFAIMVSTLVLVSAGLRPAAAQVTTGGAFPAPDDTPTVRTGGVLFADYTRTMEPSLVDADGNTVTPSSFNVNRAYLNVTGQINHIIAFRITPDVSRELGNGSSLAGSMTLRLKYGYAQFNLDDWLWRGTFARAGMIQTPYIDFEESVYRYRFQGPTFVDREMFLGSADFGVSMRTLLPGGYGEIVGGFYDGEGFNRVEPNDQKAVQVRGTIRPFPGPGTIRGLRGTLFYDRDHYVRDNDRRRVVSLVTFEHRFLNAAWSHLEARDQAMTRAAAIDAAGDSAWVTPRWLVGTIQPSAPAGQVRASVEGLLRYDHLRPNRGDVAVKDRVIAGIAYWPRMTTASVSSAFMLDFETLHYRHDALARPTERRLAVHMLISF